MHRRTPLDAGDSRSRNDGVAPYSGAIVPGPVGVVLAVRGDAPLGESSAGPAGTDLARATSLSFTVGTDTYRLRRVDVEWRQQWNEQLLSPEESAVILERAVVQHARYRELAHLLESAASRLAGVHSDGVFLLLWMRPQFEGIAPGGQSAAASTPSTLRPAAPAEAPRPIDEPIMGADQALVLKNAAASGVPFCEECARAAAARGAAGTAA